MTTTAPPAEPELDEFAFIYRPLLRAGWRPGDIDCLEITDAMHLFDTPAAKAPLTQQPTFRAALEKFRASQATEDG